MKITISGTAGSGKSTIAKAVAEKLGFEHFSMGDLQRDLAKSRDLSIKEWGDLEKKDPKYDKMVDDHQVEIGKTKDNFVLDSRLGARFIPDSIKIFVDADIDERVKRRLLHKRIEEDFDDLRKAKDDMVEREKVNQERFINFYDYDLSDRSNYDIIIDTTSLDIDGAIDKTLQEINRFKEKNN